MPYFANFRLIVELSTPLVNMRWFLYACGYPKDSVYFFINGLTMTLVFFVVRILSIPIYWYKCYSIVDTPQWFKLKYLRHVMVLTCLCLDVINIYWFRKMLRGAMIVWSTNWSYFEKHHKSVQLARLARLRSSLYTSTMNGLNVIGTPSRYMGMRFVDRLIESLPAVIAETFLSRPASPATVKDGDDEHDADDDDDNNSNDDRSCASSSSVSSN